MKNNLFAFKYLIIFLIFSPLLSSLVKAQAARTTALSEKRYSKKSTLKNSYFLDNDSSKLSIKKARWEVKTAPIAFLVRWLTLDLSYRLSDNWATGPSTILYNADGPGGMFGPTYKGYALGWNSNYYFKSVYTNTWYLSGHAYFDTFRSYPHAYLGFKEMQGMKANTAVGYQWRWSRVTVLAGLGTEFTNYKVTDNKTAASFALDQIQATSNYNESNWFPYFEFKMGIEI